MAHIDPTFDLREDDIRRHYNLCRDAKSVYQILYMRPPFETTDVDTSGLDCLTTVMRVIYAHTMLRPGEEQDKINEGVVNPILSYAWRMFEREGGPVVPKDGDRDEKNRILQVLEYDEHAIPDRSFRSLCGCRSMTATLWARQSYLLFNPIIQKSPGDTKWRKATVDLASASLLELDWTKAPGQTIEELVATRSLSVANGIRTECYVRTPDIVRVLFTPAPGNKPRAQFDTMRSFTLPVGMEDDSGPRPVYRREVHRERYGLIAIVRMRNEDHKPDYVRLYDGRGPQVAPQFEPSTYMNNSWSFDDAEEEHCYMLFYAWDDYSQHDPTYPEIGGPDPVDMEFLQQVDAHIKESQRREAARLAELGIEADQDDNGWPDDIRPQSRDENQREGNNINLDLESSAHESEPQASIIEAVSTPAPTAPSTSDEASTRERSQGIELHQASSEGDGAFVRGLRQGGLQHQESGSAQTPQHTPPQPSPTSQQPVM